MMMSNPNNNVKSVKMPIMIPHSISFSGRLCVSLDGSPDENEPISSCVNACVPSKIRVDVVNEKRNDGADPLEVDMDDSHPDCGAGLMPGPSG